MTTVKVKGLDPIYKTNSKILILGTIPSQKSRDTNEYYANPSNRFWKVLSEFFKEDIPDTYDRKLRFLERHQIAVWDIIHTCEMVVPQNNKIVGSKNSAIHEDTIECNDLDWLFTYAPRIEVVLLNGKDATEMYEKKFKRFNLPYRGLPNTSSANVTFDKKKWFDALDITTYAYEKAVNYYIKLSGNNVPYKILQTTEGTSYVFDEEYALPRTCVDCGVRRDMLKEVLIQEIQKGKI